MLGVGCRVRLITLVGSTSLFSRVFYAGSEPLRGDWVVLRIVLHGHTSERENNASTFGFRLGTEVPGNDGEWVKAERLWRCSYLRDSFEDHHVVMYEPSVVVEGPWEIRPRGRRALLRGYYAGSGVRLMAATWVLREGGW